MELTILNKKGKDTGRKVKLSQSIFGIEPSEHAIYLDVKQHLANSRQGTHKTKERSEIRGSTRKIKKQKGTGTARAGSIKNPIFRGGGRTFGPVPRDYSIKVNKKVKLLARKSALSMKAKNKSILVLEDLNFKSPKTSDYLKLIKDLGLEGKKTLMVLGAENKNVYLSSRNLKGTEVVTNSELNTYKIFNSSNLILLESSITKIESILK
ncbi:MAG: 50S ribosomal protein L4 [Bacteroidota bacterium]|nr:50S ribosomal protein L4 [Bacteroidota bacterium]